MGESSPVSSAGRGRHRRHSRRSVRSGRWYFGIPAFPDRNVQPHHRAVRDLDVKTLRLFVAVCECRTMARAAEQEQIEPSAISKRIAQLETDLGVDLLMR